jgi:hypothetical protein
MAFPAPGGLREGVRHPGWLAHGYHEHGAEPQGMQRGLWHLPSAAVGLTAPNRAGWLEGALRPPGRGDGSAARTKGAWRKQGRSVVCAQLAGRMRARACTVQTDTGARVR